MGRRAGATPLTPERIYDEGLAIVDREGLDGLSMRKLGAALGVDPMAVYHYVPNKDALFHGIVRRVFAQMPQPPATGAWPTRVRQWARAYLAVVEAHPNLIVKVVTSPDAVAVAASEVNTALTSALIRAGLRPVDVERGAAVVVDYVNGLALARASSLGADEAFIAELDDLFEFGLNVVIAGLDSLASKTRKA